MKRPRGLLRVGGGVTTIALAIAGAATAVVLTNGAASAATGGTGTGYLSAQGAHLVDATGATVRLTGINWFGMETDNKTFHGLWASVTWKSQLDHMAQLGYNTIRVPYSDDALKAGAVASGVNDYTNPDLVGLSPLQILDKVIEYSGSKGMRILLDRHRPTAAGQSPLWYTAAVTEATWIANMQLLARRYANNPTVIGIDLHNEPHADGTEPAGTGACWGCGDTARDWRLAAERGGNAVLQANPNWLIVVEGVSCTSGGNANVWDSIPDEPCGWWGGNLTKAKDYPVRLSAQNKLVYSAHEYAISVYHQAWFDDPTFPANLPAIWDTFFGYLVKQNIAPVLLGEFGSTLADPKDAVWLKELMKYMGTGTSGMNFTYWSWNPNSGDTGGIVSDDWVTVNQAKQAILQPYLIAPVGGGTASPSGGTSASASPSRSTSPSASASASRSASASASASASVSPSGGGGTAACTATVKLDNSWQGGFQATVTVKNTGSSVLNPWAATWTMPSGATIGSGWNATLTQSGQVVTAAAPTWSPTLAAGASVSIGFTATGGSSTTLTGVALNGSTCA